MTEVSFLPFLGKLWFKVFWVFFFSRRGEVLLSLARKAEAGPETVIPDWITITRKLLPFSLVYLKLTPNLNFMTDCELLYVSAAAVGAWL